MAAADAVEQQVEREEEVLGGRRAEAVRERDLAPDRHPGAAQAHRDAEAVAAARDRDALQRERGERGLLWPACGRGRSRCAPGPPARRRQRALAGREEPGLDHGVGVEHQHGIPLERARVLEARLARRGPAGLLVRRRARAPTRRASARSRPSRRCSGRRRRGRGPSRRRSASMASRPRAITALLVVRRHEDEEPDLVAASAAAARDRTATRAPAGRGARRRRGPAGRPRPPRGRETVVIGSAELAVDEFGAGCASVSKSSAVTSSPSISMSKRCSSASTSSSDGQRVELGQRAEQRGVEASSAAARSSMPSVSTTTALTASRVRCVLSSMGSLSDGVTPAPRRAPDG